MGIKELLKWIVQLIIVLWGISLITFTLTYLAPGDPAELMLSAMGGTPTQEQVDSTREKLGLNHSFVDQYTNWLSNLLQGDFGKSYASGKPVVEEIAKKLPATLRLAVISMIFTVLVSLPLGILTGVYQNKWVDYLIRGITFLGISMPSFLVALVLLYIFGLKYKLLPIVSQAGELKGIVLPVATLTFAMSVKYIRQVRNLVIEELSQGYVEGAKARGLSSSKILWNHIIPNVLLPLTTLMGLSFGSLLGGTALVEMIFSWPGLGKFAVESISRRDYPVVQSYVLWLAFIYMLINFIVDISYYYLDPRLRQEEKNI